MQHQQVISYHYFNRTDFKEENSIIVESGIFNGLTRIVSTPMGVNTLVIIGGTFDFNPE